MGVPVMSLYRHVPGKEELLGAMTEVVLNEAMLPAPAPAHWRARLEAAARTSWSVYRRHPWMARVITILRPLPLAASLVHADWVFEGLERAGVDAATILRMHVTVYAYVQGLAVNLEAEAEAQGETGIDDQAWMASKGSAYEALAKSGRFPAFARVTEELQEGFDLPIDAVFEFGVRTLLDGFERIVAPPVD
ncbi:MAG: TetR/AcrR family transcriptional regulator C-terminal domain-containing protein [Polyangiaceae bacterium]